MQEEFNRLRQKLKDMEIKQAEMKQKSETKQQPPIYIKSERKLPKFAGRPMTDSDPIGYLI